MKILVTGGAGFIGSHTVAHLLAIGHSVAVLDNFSSGKREHLQPHPNLEVREADIRDRAAVRAAVEGMDAVLHLAAQVSVQSSFDDPPASNELNVLGFANVLDASYRAGVKRFVYASSAAVFGISEESRLTEESPTRPISPYGLEKSINDQYASLYRRLYNFSSLGLRYFNVYGPRQEASSPYAGVISKFVAALRAGRPLTVLGDGRQTRDFVFVGDVAKINGLALAGMQTGICNVGTGSSVTLLDLIAALERTAGIAPVVEFKPPVDGDISLSSMAPRRLHEYFGDIRLTSLTDGLHQLWEAE